jgi:hypothetical protein
MPNWFESVGGAVGSAFGTVGNVVGTVGGAVAYPFIEAGKFVIGIFTHEEKEIIDFFTPLIEQVKAAAIQLGKDDLQAGFQVLKDAAMAAVVAAENAPAGKKVATAEAEFLTVLTQEGLDAVHNAEAGLIKAAVAIIQANEAAANTSSNTGSNTQGS